MTNNLLAVKFVKKLMKYHESFLIQNHISEKNNKKYKKINIF